MKGLMSVFLSQELEEDSSLTSADRKQLLKHRKDLLVESQRRDEGEMLGGQRDNSNAELMQYRRELMIQRHAVDKSLLEEVRTRGL